MARKSEADLEEELREHRAMMKKALHRVEMAEKWAADGEKIHERNFSLSYHFDKIVKEEKAKRRRSEAERIRDASAVSVAVGCPGVPLLFESIP